MNTIGPALLLVLSCVQPTPLQPRNLPLHQPMYDQPPPLIVPPSVPSTRIYVPPSFERATKCWVDPVTNRTFCEYR